jgi:uncharacterized cupin superfamily protein
MLSVWIALENVTAQSGLQFISHSHRFGATLQEMRHHAGKSRRDTTGDDALAWARQRDPRAQLVAPAVIDGQALLFQGQTWHHSDNRSGRTRRSLLLQYAHLAVPIRIPELHHVDWPFRLKALPRPACILLRGSDDADVNRIVPAPARASRGPKSQLSDQACALQLPLAADPSSGFKFYAMFTGSSTDVREMEVHASALATGKMPHPPHTHREEEILIMLAGEADLLLPEVKGPYGDERLPLKPGEFVYYPAHFPHTLRTSSVEPANYLMFKWDTEPRATPAGALAFGHFSANDLPPEGEGKYRTRKLFEGPTGCLRRLHSHVTVLEPGAGYAPHADGYDVAIIVLEGEVECAGERYGSGATLYHAAGQAHGLRNAGGVPARYLVLEFHGSQTARSEAFPSAATPTLLQKLADPQRWKRKMKRIRQSLTKK